jgi:predicted acetyltransferase
VNVALVRASESDHGTLANLLQLYVHDFSEFLGTSPSEAGQFSYPALPLYWREAGRAAFLIRAADRLAGFALVAQGSRLSGDPAVSDLAEFFIVRGVRRTGVGRAAAHELFTSVPGVWEVRVIESNHPAQRFWQTVIEQYTRGTFELDIWSPDDRPRSNVFRFRSSGAYPVRPR